MEYFQEKHSTGFLLRTSQDLLLLRWYHCHRQARSTGSGGPRQRGEWESEDEVCSGLGSLEGLLVPCSHFQMAMGLGDPCSHFLPTWSPS